MNLLESKRPEQAVSLYQKTLRLRKEVLGPRHFLVLECQVRARVRLLGQDSRGKVAVGKTLLYVHAVS